jgi:formylglycine-generating enzyme required for sulfatase activity
MHGNVMEWVQDEGTPPQQAIAHRKALHDERGTPIPDSWRLMGGGCYAFPASMAWCSGQWQPYPDIDRSFILGFRIARE